MAQPASVEEYLAALPEDVQPVVREVRRRIAEALPTSTEKISYAIPTVLLDGRPLISYGAWKSHLGLYPVPVTVGDLEQELVPYRSTKDTLRFRYRDTIPVDLIIRVVAARAASGRDSATT
ncbi:iron chaperone [uncultured Friedmanniella sp.]|uniref:iron chaperone n=1 Tax=uncultured Friedmanniella sp. TaxID=335381 RepID=UPI0035C9B877